MNLAGLQGTRSSVFMLCQQRTICGHQNLIEIPYIVTQKKKSETGVKQTKLMQGLYAENYTMLMKDIKEDLNKQ